MIVARTQLVSTALMFNKTVRGVLKTFGLMLQIRSQRRFVQVVREAIEGNPILLTIIEPMLIVLRTPMVANTTSQRRSTPGNLVHLKNAIQLLPEHPLEKISVRQWL